METTELAQAPVWPLWRTILFRFLFIYLGIQFSPWSWLYNVPGFNYINQYYDKAINWVVELFNAKLLHVRPVLVPANGSGDTSACWAQLWTLLILALLGCIVWSALDRKRANYTRLNYWLCLVARYYVAYVAFIYGFEKVFALQMPFPSLHQLATPLGDFLPMRFSWMFIGYSGPYQVFSGVMEVVAGLLLLWRRTASLGAFVAAGVFINVMMLNLCYDIPVKIFSMQMVFVCLFLLVNESERFICFFILNKPANPCSIYHFEYGKKWMRVSRIVLKVLFVLIAIGMQIYSEWSYYEQVHQTPKKQIFENGIYIVTDHSVGKRNNPLAIADTMRWNNIVLENGGGSMETGDTTFKVRYNRHYFGYTFNEMKRTVSFVRTMANEKDSALITMRYMRPDSNTIKLWGTHGKDSLFVELKKSKHQFHLAERQFHWLSEHNR